MAQDAQLISQAGQVESLASDGLVSVSTGAGQPQKNMELAKFADSLGSSVPLQQTSEQVSITGLYARTSDGKMVELTKESVASVMAGLMGNPIGYRRLLTSVDDLNNIGDGIFYTSGVDDPANSPRGMYNNVIVQYSNPSAGHRFQTLYSSNGQVCMFRRFDTLGWTDWSRLDNFGYNTLAELSSGVAEQNRLYIGEGCAVRTELKNDFDTSVFPAANGCRVRFDNNNPTGNGHELFFVRGGGLWFWNEQGGGWKEVATK